MGMILSLIEEKAVGGGIVCIPQGEVHGGGHIESLERVGVDAPVGRCWLAG